MLLGLLEQLTSSLPCLRCLLNRKVSPTIFLVSTVEVASKCCTFNLQSGKVSRHSFANNNGKNTGTKIFKPGPLLPKNWSDGPNFLLKKLVPSQNFHNRSRNQVRSSGSFRSFGSLLSGSKWASCGHTYIADPDQNYLVIIGLKTAMKRLIPSNRAVTNILRM